MFLIKNSKDVIFFFQFWEKILNYCKKSTQIVKCWVIFECFVIFFSFWLTIVLICIQTRKTFHFLFQRNNFINKSIEFNFVLLKWNQKVDDFQKYESSLFQSQLKDQWMMQLGWKNISIIKKLDQKLNNLNLNVQYLWYYSDNYHNFNNLLKLLIKIVKSLIIMVKLLIEIEITLTETIFFGHSNDFSFI